LTGGRIGQPSSRGAASRSILPRRSQSGTRHPSATGRSGPVYRVFSATGMSAPAPSFRGRYSSQRHAPRATAATTAASTIMLFTFIVFSPSSARGKPNAAGGAASVARISVVSRAVSGNRGGNRSAGGRGGDGKIRLFECRRHSTNERISHFSPRLLLLHHTARSLSDSIRQVQCGLVMCIEITNGLQIFHII